MISDDKNMIPPMLEMPKGSFAPPPVSVDLSNSPSNQILKKLDLIMSALGIDGKDSKNTISKENEDDRR
ncbi:hypothetical protein ACMZ87_03420 [Gardnerella pickettii]|uniref:hypothetical protein n=1 Tax=Gardnerella pickettii TaxID=2914924 RepID=UPI0039F081CF